MQGRYSIANPDEVLSPGLVVFEEIVRENIERMLEIAGNPARLRPHCKTHKMIDITRIEVAMGIVKHKCATFAEAEMLALGGARDVFLAYNLVGPNLARAVRYRKRFPDVRLAVAADHSDPVEALNDVMARAGGAGSRIRGRRYRGLRRTGLAPGPEAHDLYARIHDSSHPRSDRLAPLRRAEPPDGPRRTRARRRSMLGRGAVPPRAARRLVAPGPRNRGGGHWHLPPLRAKADGTITVAIPVNSDGGTARSAQCCLPPCRRGGARCRFGETNTQPGRAAGVRACRFHRAGSGERRISPIRALTRLSMFRSVVCQWR